MGLMDNLPDLGGAGDEAGYDGGNGPDAAAPGGAGDLSKLSEALQAVADAVQKAQALLPRDAASDEQAHVEEATATAQDKAADTDQDDASQEGPDDPDMRKQAAIAAISKQLK